MLIKGKYNAAKSRDEKLSSFARKKILALCDNEMLSALKIRLTENTHINKGRLKGIVVSSEDAIDTRIMGNEIGAGLIVAKLKDYQPGAVHMPDIRLKHLDQDYVQIMLPNKSPETRVFSDSEAAVFSSGEEHMLVVQTGTNEISKAIFSQYSHVLDGKDAAAYFVDSMMAQRILTGARAEAVADICLENGWEIDEAWSIVTCGIDAENNAIRNGTCSTSNGCFFVLEGDKLFKCVAAPDEDMMNSAPSDSLGNSRILAEYERIYYNKPRQDQKD